MKKTKLFGKLIWILCLVIFMTSIRTPGTSYALSGTIGYYAAFLSDFFAADKFWTVMNAFEDEETDETNKIKYGDSHPFVISEPDGLR